MTNVFSVAEVALMFFPESLPQNALRRFRYLLKGDPDLWNALSEARFHSHQRMFTPMQYEIIIRFLGEPA